MKIKGIRVNDCDRFPARTRREMYLIYNENVYIYNNIGDHKKKKHVFLRHELSCHKNERFRQNKSNISRGVLAGAQVFSILSLDGSA